MDENASLRHQNVNLIASCVIAFGALAAAATALRLAPEPDPTSSGYLALHTLRVVLMLLGIFAFTGLYAWHRGHASGRMLIGWILLATGFALLFALEFLFAYFVPFLAIGAPEFLAALESGAVEPPLTFIAAFIAVDILQLVGAGLFFTAALKARVLSRAATVACMASLLLLSVSDYAHLWVHVAAGIAFGMCTIWLGATLGSETTATARGAPRQAVDNRPTTMPMRE